MSERPRIEGLESPDLDPFLVPGGRPGSHFGIIELHRTGAGPGHESEPRQLGHRVPRTCDCAIC